MYHSGEGPSYCLIRFPYITDFPWRKFPTFLDKSLFEKLIGKFHRPQYKTLIREARPGLSDKLWDENAIGGRRSDVATQERKDINISFYTCFVCLRYLQHDKARTSEIKHIQSRVVGVVDIKNIHSTKLRPLVRCVIALHYYGFFK